MSEEEAIDILKNNEVLQALFNIKYEYKIKQAIDTILDLYQKEKEKNEKLVDKTIQYDKTLEKLQKDTIWKEKIRAKREEYEQLAERNKDGKYWTDEAILYDRQAEALRELEEE